MVRKKSPEKTNHERWLVSYADLVTLLFAFFVILFASTRSNKMRAQDISKAVDKAFQNGGLSSQLSKKFEGTLNGKESVQRWPRGAATLPEHVGAGIPLPQHPMELAAAYEALRTKLAPEIRSGAVDLHIEERGVIIGLNSAIFFPSGGDEIDASVFSTLGGVASVLNQLGNPLRLEGHTDSLPINTARFRSNWELSAARGIAMLRVLNENYGVASSRMAVVGYGDTQSLESNDSEEGRRKNRRVDIVIVSAYGMRSEPAETKPLSDPAHPKALPTGTGQP